MMALILPLCSAIAALVFTGVALPFLAAFLLGPSGPVMAMPFILPAFFGACFIGLGLGGVLSQAILTRIGAMAEVNQNHALGCSKCPFTIAVALET
jgi:hypothetical protein